MKSLKEISWEVPEDIYRQDPALSYSTLARYEREGFSKVDHLFDKVESPSLLLGSIVDCLITDGQEEFDRRFLVAEFPAIPDSIVTIVKDIFSTYSEVYTSLSKIPDDCIITFAQKYNYQPNWRPETRAKVIREKGSEYYNLLYLSTDKTIVDTETYKVATDMVDALKNSPITGSYFSPDNPFDDTIGKYYQLKFKAALHNVDYRCMADLIVVDYKDKIIYPIDLKTSFKHEYEFYKSFIDWNYQIQARLYWRIIRDNLDRDEYFKDFKLDDYRFIVVSRDLHPLIWYFRSTTALGELVYGKHNNIIMRDPEEIGMELRKILDNKPTYPEGITSEDNDIVDWINNNM